MSTADLRELVTEGVQLAEGLFGPGTGRRKRRYVVKWLNDRIDVPIISESIEEALLGLAVDLVAGILFPASPAAAELAPAEPAPAKPKRTRKKKDA